MRRRLRKDLAPEASGHLIDHLPMISCVLIAGGRTEFTLESIRYFQRQDYPERELIVIDDGTWDLSARLPAHVSIRYIRIPSGTEAEQKRIFGFEQARGQLYCNWNEGDWQAPGRLSFQSAPILTGSADLTGLATPDFLEIETAAGWTCSERVHAEIFPLGINPHTFTCRAEVWHRYPIGDPSEFVSRAVERRTQILRLPNENLYVAVLEAEHISALGSVRPGGAGWRGREKPTALASDIDFFRAHRRRTLIPGAPCAATERNFVQPSATATQLTMQPLVSCIMPTADRRTFVPHAIRYFNSQDYQERELVIVDDGDDPIADLIPDNPRIRYFRLPEKRSLGVKRNIACEQARGEVILHWDDDDWMAPWRISYQVHHLLAEKADICGIDRMYFFQPDKARAWMYVFPAETPAWVGGGSLCYTKAIWRADPFHDVTIGEDNRFLQSDVHKKLAILADSRFYVALVHPGNTSPKVTADSPWQERPLTELKQFMGTDWRVYERQSSSVEPHMAPDDTGKDMRERWGSAFVFARNSDLALTEYKAFDYGQSLPRMRRWELPFALFAAGLQPGVAVLDCTIDPANFGERLQRLYGHVLYRHVNVSVNGEFCLPWGVPDCAFEAAFCISTLEKVPASVRQAFIEEVSRKLKPGGRLVLVSECRFESNEGTPANGPFDQWILMCRASGLSPAGSRRVPDLLSDRNLSAYRDFPPKQHGIAAGVFVKGRKRASRPLRVVLGLLTWNTKDASLDSARAHIAEANMLRRLGVEAAICVCDNGSTDGTAEELRALDDDIDIEHQFIFNATNRGSSIGRNQIIDYALQQNADYMLMMDGDIEIVPFSSFAMLRYLEDAGHRVGCIGADSAGYTDRRALATPCMYSLSDIRVETSERTAWTQYGMFRCSMFREGVRFDASGPFAGPGWGYEDDDLLYQMITRDYLNQRFFGMTYLHRAILSSVRNLQDSGVDVNELVEQRRRHLVKRWESNARISRGPMELLQRMNISFPPRPRAERGRKELLTEIQQELKSIYGKDSYYTKSYALVEEGFWSLIPEWLSAVAKSSKAARVLDAGSAYGTLAAFCSRALSWSVDCTDVLPILAPEVARIYRLSVHCPLNIETDPLPEGKFDIVLLTETLEHFNYHPVPTLRKIGKALADGGRLYITTPDAATWGRVTEYYASLADIPKPPKRHPKKWIDAHIWQYTRAELMQVIKAAGFVVEREGMSNNGSATHINLELRKK